MNFNEIVFIIGAGAHVPYGFPTGPELKEILRRMFYPDSEYPLKLLCGKTYYYIENLRPLKDTIIKKLELFYKELDGTTFPSGDSEKELKRFVDKLLNSSEPTIDSFLAKRSEEAPLGKVVIGVLIRHFELQRPILTNKDNWLQTLVTGIIDKNLEDPKQFLLNQPTFITFNYDRLLEEFFFQRVKSLWNFRNDQGIEFINRLNIHHVYKKIGGKTLDQVEKEGLGEESQIISESNNIDIVPMERNNHNLDMDSSIKEIIRKSKRIYFLGFGFDFLNIRQLFTNPFEIDLFKSKLLLSTNVGLKKDNFNSINQFFKSQIRFFEGENVDSLELLTNKTPLQKKY